MSNKQQQTYGGHHGQSQSVTDVRYDPLKVESLQKELKKKTEYIKYLKAFAKC